MTKSSRDMVKLIISPDMIPGIISGSSTEKKALARSCEIVKELIGDRSPEDYLLWHVYTGPSLLKTLEEIEPRYGVKTNHEAMIVSPVSGAHNGPWLAGYGIAFLRRDDEPLDGDE